MGGGKRKRRQEPTFKHEKPIQNPEISLSWTAVQLDVELERGLHEYIVVHLGTGRPPCHCSLTLSRGVTLPGHTISSEDRRPITRAKHIAGYPGPDTPAHEAEVFARSE